MTELELLKQACDESSQAKVAKLIGYSTTVVNQVLKGIYGGDYGGDIDKVNRSIRMRLTKSTVACPMLGEIDNVRCTSEQTKPFSTENSHAVRMFKACRKCPFNTQRKS